jgi:hypothetical protein
MANLSVERRAINRARPAAGHHLKGNVMNYVLGRLREPSTYAGLAAVLAAFNVNIDPGLWGTIVQVAIGLAGLVAAVVPDRSASMTK